MRVSRATTILILALGLSIGAAGGAAAQVEEAEPTVFSGTLALSSERCPQEFAEFRIGAYSRSRYPGCRIGTISSMAEDPRLEGDLFGLSALNHWLGGTEGVSIQSAWREIRNDAGVWRELPRVSATIGIEPQYPGPRDPEERYERVILVGDGAYEGYTFVANLELRPGVRDDALSLFGYVLRMPVPSQ